MKIKTLKDTVFVEILKEHRVNTSFFLFEKFAWFRAKVIDANGIALSKGDIIRYQPTKSKKSIFTYDDKKCQVVHKDLIFCTESLEGDVLYIFGDYVYLTKLDEHKKLGSIYLPMLRNADTFNVKVLGCGNAVTGVEVGDTCICPSGGYREVWDGNKFCFYTLSQNLLGTLK